VRRALEDDRAHRPPFGLKTALPFAVLALTVPCEASNTMQVRRGYIVAIGSLAAVFGALTGSAAVVIRGAVCDVGAGVYYLIKNRGTRSS
jgi:hypothetical protein